jgi:hypothetical protein
MNVGRLRATLEGVSVATLELWAAVKPPPALKIPIFVSAGSIASPSESCERGRGAKVGRGGA